jgi:Cu+-exporting ATPase
VLVVDKTGTLTEGKPRIASLYVMPEFAEKELLAVAASLEKTSEHPLAAAIVRGALEKGIGSASHVREVKSLTGLGITGTIDGKQVAVGNQKLLDQLKINGEPLFKKADEFRGEGQTVMFIVMGNTAAGLIGVADPIKTSTPEALRLLKEDGLEVVMLTGDHLSTAKVVGKKLGIVDIRANVLPEQKIAVIRELQAKGKVVAMAGDGVNDAPALAQANVGIAMGHGTDVAMQSAAVTLVKGDLRGIVKARRLSEATMRNIRQNLFFAFFYNVLGIPIAAGVLYPLFGMLLSPIIASAAMSLSSVSVIGNALRLKNLKL